jgi:signal transduction histidine kinase
VGSHLIASRPDRAGEALGVIERTGREALSELRRMLVVLRPDAPVGPTPPQPGLADLARLFEDARARGLRLTVSQSGPSPALSPGVDLAIYRVVQESLTNAAKHAPGARVDVTLAYADDEVRVEVRDRGPGAPGRLRHGQGLTGMAERVALYDGTLRLDGSAPGFRVCATFPLDDGGGAG